MARHAAKTAKPAPAPLAIASGASTAGREVVWYEKAGQCGSAEAAHRLALLANRYPE